MLLNDLITQLVHGELSTLPLGEDDDSGVLVDGLTAIMPHINLALSSVHKRLYLREESILLRQDASIEKYFLHNKYAESNISSTEPIKYLIDTSDPFLNTSLKIEKIVNSAGEELLLNDKTAESPIRTPTPNTIIFTGPVAGAEYTITYRAKHPVIEDTVDPETTELNIPDFILEPLLYFIASRVHASYPSIEGNNESINYRNKYEAAMAELSEYGLIDTSDNTNTKLEDNGWA